MVRLTRSDGWPAVAASAVSRLPRARSNWGTMPPSATFPSRSTPVWPARNTIRPAAETAWEKPEGLASSAGVIRITVMTAPYRYRDFLTTVAIPAYDRSHAHRGPGWRSGRPVLRGPGQAAERRARDHRLGTQRRRRHVRLRGGVLRRDPRRHRARRPGDLRGHAARVRPLGRHRRALPRGHVHLGRARLRRDEPQAAAGHPAGPLRLARGADPVPHR